jgi:penicillin amidase
VTANERIADVPYNGAWAPPWRSRRIAELLTATRQLSVGDFQRIQADRLSLDARMMRDLVVQAGDGADADVGWALSELRSWDGTMSSASRAAAIGAALQVALPARVLEPLLGDADYRGLLSLADFGVYTAAEDIVVRPESALWPAAPAERVRVIRDGVRDALALLRRQCGADREQWTWGRLHTVTFKNPISEGDDVVSRVLGWYFNRGPFTDGGARHTVNNGWFNLGQPFATEQISSYRYVVDMAHPELADAMNHTGESDIAASPHYDDMIEPWREGKYHRLERGR